MKNRICFVRSNSMRGDSRIEKEMGAVLSEKYEIIGIGWDRATEEEEIYVKNINDQMVNIYEIKERSDFGAGFKKNIYPLLKYQKKLYYTLKKHKNDFDIIHACDFDTAFTCHIFAKKYNKKMVYDIFDFYVDAFSVPKILKNIIKKIDYSIINSADATIICTEERKKQIEGASPKKLSIVHNSPEIYELKKENIIPLASKSKKIKVCYFGILNDGRLIKELLNIVAKDKSLELHIGGFGKYENMIKEFSIKYDNIYFYGKLDYKMVLNYEYQCDIITALYDPKIPNHFYAAPNKFYEALMLGKPIIMCENTGMSNVVRDNKIGEIISEFNEKSLKKGLLRLISKKKKWPSIAKREKELYNKTYSWAQSKEELIKLYQNL